MLIHCQKKKDGYNFVGLLKMFIIVHQPMGSFIVKKFMVLSELEYAF